jgi:Na+/alanine symporter
MSEVAGRMATQQGAKYLETAQGGCFETSKATTHSDPIYIVDAVVHYCVAKLDLVWSLSDTFNGLMAIPNLIGLLVLTPVVVKETRNYFEQKRTES